MKEITRKCTAIKAKTDQTGITLVVSLIILILMTVIGVTAMQTTVLEEKMAGNARDLHLAFQASEAALREGEDFLQNAGLPAFDGNNGLYKAAALGATPHWHVASTWSSDARTYSGSLNAVAEQPKYIIEELTPVPAPGASLVVGFAPPPTLTFYRVTARGVGGSNTAVVLLQTTFRR